MCGLAGVFGINKLKKPQPVQSGYYTKHVDEELANFNILLHISQLRGSDSSGIMFIPEQEGDPVVIKDTITSATMLETSRYKRVSSSDEWQNIIGHSRAGTIGGQTFEAAHPHSHGTVTLVHNGTVNTYRTHIPNTPVQVISDSSAIAWKLSQIEPNEVTTFLSTMPSFGAIIWFDTRDGSLNIAKDNSRTLFWTAPRKQKLPHECGYISSQAAALGFVLPENHTIKEIPDNTHIKIIGNTVRSAGKWETYSPPVNTLTTLPTVNRTVYGTYGSAYGSDDVCDLDDYRDRLTRVSETSITRPDHLQSGRIIRVGRLKDNGVNRPYQGTYTCPLDKKTYKLYVDQPPIQLIEAGMDLCDNGGVVKIRYTHGDIIFARVAGE